MCGQQHLQKNKHYRVYWRKTSHYYFTLDSSWCKYSEFYVLVYIIPDSLITLETIAAPSSPAGLQVWDCGMQGSSRARSFYVNVVTCYKNNFQIINYYKIKLHNFPKNSFLLQKIIISLSQNIRAHYVALNLPYTTSLVSFWYGS